MKRYSELIKRLYQVSLFGGVKLGLEHVHALSARLGCPEKTFPCVHIAGSNGKGSVSLKIAKALEFSGLKVGLYTSPHISSFRERIQLNGVLIPEQKVREGLDRLFSLFDQENLHPTFFEIVTLLAFDFFRSEQVDIAVIETGLGGALDATNIVVPVLSVITSISLEHTAILGDTLEAIAKEKAGIIKPGIPVVLGPKANLPVIIERAQLLQAPLWIAPATDGFYDTQNSAIAATALDRLMLSMDAKIKTQALALRPPCRFEERGQVILDVAHNPDAFIHLFEAFQFHYPHQKVRLVLGLSRDKDLEGCLAIASKHAVWIHLVEAETPRAAPISRLAMLLKALNFTAFSEHASVAEALQSAQSQSEKIIVCGTFYVMEKARCQLGIETARDCYELNEKNLTANL